MPGKSGRLMEKAGAVIRSSGRPPHGRPDDRMSGDRIIYLEMGTMGLAAFPMQVVWQGNGLPAKDRFRLAPE